MQRWLRHLLVLVTVCSLSACIVYPRPYGHWEGGGHGHRHHR